jgi:hypothetical protein
MLLEMCKALMKYEQNKVLDLREKLNRKRKKELKLTDINSDTTTKPIPKTVSTSVSVSYQKTNTVVTAVSTSLRSVYRSPSPNNRLSSTITKSFHVSTSIKPCSATALTLLTSLFLTLLAVVLSTVLRLAVKL